MKGNGYFWVIMVGVMVAMSAASVCVNSGGANCSLHNVEIMPVETISTYAQRETDMYFQTIPQSLDEKRQMDLDADIQITTDELDEQHPSIAIDADGKIEKPIFSSMTYTYSFLQMEALRGRVKIPTT